LDWIDPKYISNGNIRLRFVWLV